MECTHNIKGVMNILILAAQLNAISVLLTQDFLGLMVSALNAALDLLQRETQEHAMQLKQITINVQLIVMNAR